MTKDEPAEPPPHYLGHRERLRERFRKGGSDALAEYELVELILFRAMPRRDVKPLAKTLIERFGSFAATVSARPERLREVEGLGETAIVELKIIEAAAKRLAKSSIENRTPLQPFPLSSTIAGLQWPFSTTRNSARSFSTKKTISSLMRCKALAPSIMPRFIRAKLCGGRWSFAHRQSYWCIIIPRAILSRRPTTFILPIKLSPSENPSKSRFMII
jgi:uncharacterized protein UPF0758